MKKSTTVLWRAIGIVAIFAATWAGVRVGINVGRAQYHNTYVRELQHLSYELAREAQRSDSGKSRWFAMKLAALASAAGNDEQFFAILNEDFQSVETLSQELGFTLTADDSISKLEVDLSDQGAMSVAGIAIDAKQLQLIASLMSQWDQRTQLRLSASPQVDPIFIKKAVKAAGQGGVSDVLFSPTANRDGNEVR